MHIDLAQTAWPLVNNNVGTTAKAPQTAAHPPTWWPERPTATGRPSSPPPARGSGALEEGENNIWKQNKKKHMLEQTGWNK